MKSEGGFFFWFTDTGISFKDPKLVYLKLSEMIQPRTYRGSSLVLDGWEVCSFATIPSFSEVLTFIYRSSGLTPGSYKLSFLKFPYITVTKSNLCEITSAKGYSHIWMHLTTLPFCSWSVSSHLLNNLGFNTWWQQYFFHWSSHKEVSLKISLCESHFCWPNFFTSTVICSPPL